MSNLKKKSVLIVDDELSNVLILKEMLYTDYTVYTVTDSTEALETVSEKMPEIILLDIVMPVIDGYEIMKKLKSSEKTRDIPVIFITALDSHDAEEKGLSLGAADYISKPFHAPIVKMRVRNQIDIIERYEIERDLNTVLKLQTELVAARELAEKNREIAEMNREIADYANRAKTDFLAHMSHEMRTPMNAIVGMMQIIEMLGIPADMKRYFARMDVATSELLEMIEDLLDVSSMEYGAFKLTESVFNFDMMVQEALLIVTHNANEKQHTLNVDVDMSLNTAFIGDEKHLKRVITCVLGNAVKFTPEHGEINFEACKLDEDNGTATLQMRISDNGIGMPDGQIETLFEMFEQADKSNKTKYGGIGIGLSLSKRIIDMMDGDIKVESKEGEGSKFTITFKLKKKK